MYLSVQRTQLETLMIYGANTTDDVLLCVFVLSDTAGEILTWQMSFVNDHSLRWIVTSFELLLKPSETLEELVA